MAYAINHVHLKSKDPKATADWFVKAFGIEILSDDERAGARFIRCADAKGMGINISGERTGETLGPGSSDPHFGVEHFGMDSEDLDADIEKLTAMGAEVKERPSGGRIAFLGLPGDIRIELIQQ